MRRRLPRARGRDVLHADPLQQIPARLFGARKLRAVDDGRHDRQGADAIDVETKRPGDAMVLAARKRLAVAGDAGGDTVAIVDPHRRGLCRRDGALTNEFGVGLLQLAQQGVGHVERLRGGLVIFAGLPRRLSCGERLAQAAELRRGLARALGPFAQRQQIARALFLLLGDLDGLARAELGCRGLLPVARRFLLSRGCGRMKAVKLARARQRGPERVQRGARRFAGVGGELQFRACGVEHPLAGLGVVECLLGRCGVFAQRGDLRRILDLGEPRAQLPARVERRAQIAHLAFEALFLSQEFVVQSDRPRVRAILLGPSACHEPCQFLIAGDENLHHASPAGNGFDLALHRGQHVFTRLLFVFLLALLAKIEPGDALPHPQQPRWSCPAIAHEIADEALGLVRLRQQPSGGEIAHGGAPTAEELLGEAIGAVAGRDVSLDQRAAAAVGLQSLHQRRRAGMRLKEQRMQRVEAGRFAVFVGGTQHVDAIGKAFDGDAFAGEAADVVEAERGEFHDATFSQ